MILIKDIIPHPNYNNEILSILSSHLKLVNNILNDVHRFEPLIKKMILRVLEQDPFECRGIILGMDPYPNNATGIPFEDPNFKQRSNINLATHIREIYGIESSFGCSLYQLAQREKLYLMNAALTVPIINDKPESGAHYYIWEQFTLSLLQYVVKNSPNFRFVLVFGKDQHLSKLADSLVSHNSIKVVSFHPCTRYFLQSNSVALQEVNAYLKLIEEDPIRWYLALRNRFPNQLYYDEVREFDSNLSIVKLLETHTKLYINILPLDDFNTALGDTDIFLTNYVLENKHLISGLYKLYNHSFDMYKKTINSMKLIGNEIDEEVPVELLNIPCSYHYENQKVTIYIMFTESKRGMSFNYFYRAFRHNLFDYHFRNKFQDNRAIGYFDLSINEEDQIPINPYESMIEILSSKLLTYHHSELIEQMLRKTISLTINNIIELEIYNHNLNIDKEMISLSGFSYQRCCSKYHKYNFISYLLPKSIMHKFNQHLILIRNTSSTKPIVKKPMRKFKLNSLFALSLYLTSNYQKAIEICNQLLPESNTLSPESKTSLPESNTSEDQYNLKKCFEIIRKKRRNLFEQCQTNVISIFDLALSLVGEVTKQEALSLTEDLEIINYNPIIVDSKSLRQLEELKRCLINNLIDRMDESVNIKIVQKQIDELQIDYDKVCAIIKVIEYTNRIYKILYKESS